MSACYVALGDSMSIDDYAGGAGRGAASLLLSNRDTDFPTWTRRDLTSALPGVTGVLLARDGATSDAVAEEQIEVVRGTGLRPTHVTITCGGNDLLACYGNTAAALVALSRVGDNLALVLATLRRIAGDGASIVVTTVYDPSDGLGTLDGASGLPAWPDGLALLVRLNDIIREVAGEYHATVADVHARFAGHGRTVADPAQPHARPANPDLWYCGVFEPNAYGAHAIRACWWDALFRPSLVR